MIYVSAPAGKINKTVQWGMRHHRQKVSQINAFWPKAQICQSNIPKAQQHPWHSHGFHCLICFVVLKQHFFALDISVDSRNIKADWSKDDWCDLRRPCHTWARKTVDQISQLSHRLPENEYTRMSLFIVWGVSCDCMPRNCWRHLIAIILPLIITDCYNAWDIAQA